MVLVAWVVLAMLGPQERRAEMLLLAVTPQADRMAHTEQMAPMGKRAHAELTAKWVKTAPLVRMVEPAQTVQKAQLEAKVATVAEGE